MWSEGHAPLPSISHSGVVAGGRRSGTDRWKSCLMGWIICWCSGSQAEASPAIKNKVQQCCRLAWKTNFCHFWSITLLKLLLPWLDNRPESFINVLRRAVLGFMCRDAFWQKHIHSVRAIINGTKILILHLKQANAPFCTHFCCLGLDGCFLRQTHTEKTNFRRFAVQRLASALDRVETESVAAFVFFSNGRLL